MTWSKCENIIFITLAVLLMCIPTFCEKNTTQTSSNINVKPTESHDTKSQAGVITVSNNETAVNNASNATISTTKKPLESSQGSQEKQNTPTVRPSTLPDTHAPMLDGGAATRAFYVFAGLSVLAVAYFMVRTTRLRKGPAQMVRKYGILAHKQDLEMRPLPLDEDDDDETTVFDVTGLSVQEQIAKA